MEISQIADRSNFNFLPSLETSKSSYHFVKFKQSRKKKTILNFYDK